MGAPRVRRLTDFKNMFGHFTICRFTDKSVADVPIMCPKLFHMQATQLYPYREISKHEVDLAIHFFRNVIQSCIDEGKMNANYISRCEET